jgi:gliding motility-associated-like protein
LIKGSLPLFSQVNYSNLEFIENKGQWDKRVSFKVDINNGTFFLHQQGFSVLLHQPDDMQRVLDLAHGHATSKTFGKGAIGALPAKNNSKDIPTNPFNQVVHSHAYGVNFVNANVQAEIVPDKPLPSYNNYFIGNDPSKWAVNCKIYQGVTYKNIYPHIDVRYYTDGGTLKYNLIVHPGANPNQIAMKYSGANKLSIKGNELITHTTVGDVKELRPLSYQLQGGGRTEVDCKFFITKDSVVKFRISNYAPGATLIIDPTLVFSTFTGSKADNWGYTATYDAGGNFYSGSIVLDYSNQPGTASGSFPVSPGAFQTRYQGGDGSEGPNLNYDVAIMKFNSTGTNRVYATYLGGNGDEQPHSLVVDNAGNLIIAGRTSSSNFPVVGAGLYGNGGGFDIFITKLNAGGTGLIGSRRIGGKGDDGVNYSPKYVSTNGAQSLRLNYGDDGRSEVIVDAANNVYLASCTQSVSDFPCTIGAFQPTSGGKQDGVVIKTSPDLSNILFSSYLGGNGDDAAFVLKINPSSGDIYVAGGTSSNNLNGTGNGPVLFNTSQGGVDGFVSIISNDGRFLRKTSYIGTPGTEVIYGIEFDKNSFPYIMGTTTGNWPITPAGIFSQNKGKEFIAKLKPDLSGWVYSTVFGKGDPLPDISPTAFLVDRCENVYVAGWGGDLDIRDKYQNSGTTGLTVTPDAIKKTTDGADFYFFVLKKNAASQLYGSFFGQDGGLGDHVDGGTSRFDSQGIIYEAICANCYGGARFPTSPGVWSTSNGTGSLGCNLAAVKIAFNFAGVAANLKTSIRSRYDSSGCVPLLVSFNDTVRNAKQYIWSFDDGSPDTITTAFQLNHTFTSVGTYRVRLIAIDSSTCNVRDTVYATIRARNDKADLDFRAVKLPPCQSLTYRFDNLSIAPPGKPFGNSFLWDFGDGTPQQPAGLASVTHSYSSPGTFIAKLLLADTNYCNNPDELDLTLRIAPLVKAQFVTPPAGCAPYTAIFDNTSLAGQQFIWDFGDGSGSTDFNPTHPYSNIGPYTVTLVAIDSATCNITDSFKFTINVNPKPQAAFTDAPIPPQVNTPTIFYNNSLGATHFKWIFGDGAITLKASPDTVIHQYQQTGTFQACLIAINQFECPDTLCLPVQTLVNPLLDVPNAFTPGRFGQNSIVKVQGFGISSMIFRIYNRWGQMVFESNNQFQGWDGNFKGNPQPMDVYAYTLEATYFDGTKTTRKGNITLIR